MTYGEVRDAALKLLHRYSIGDEPVPRTYNDQGDMLRRIPTLLDDAMYIIASGPRRIHAACRLERDQTSDCGGMMCVSLPADLLDLKPGGLLVLEDGEARYESGFVRLDEQRLLLPDCAGEVWLEYFRRPRLCAASIPAGQTEPADDHALDNTPETHRAAAYYIAAQFALHEDTGVYAALNQAWHEQLLRLAPRPQGHRSVVADAYDWRGWE